MIQQCIVSRLRRYGNTGNGITRHRDSRYANSPFTEHQRRKTWLKLIHRIIPRPAIAIIERISQRDIPNQTTFDTVDRQRFYLLYQIVHFPLTKFRIKATYYIQVASQYGIRYHPFIIYGSSKRIVRTQLLQSRNAG